MAITKISRDTLTETVDIVRLTAANTLAEVAVSGYLTLEIPTLIQLNNGIWTWLPTDIVLVSASDGAGFFTLSSDLTTLVAFVVNAGLSNALASGDLFVGSAGNIATARALSGDATISNTGVLTIANNAITTAKILNANVTLAKLAAGITPSHIIKFAGKVANGGGSATITLTVTGVLSTDIVFAQLEASTNAVTVEKVTPTADTITVLLSGDPGAATTISYEALRAAA